MLNSYILNIGTSQIQIVTQVLITFFLTPIFLNTLGKDLYGVWVLLNSVVAYFGLASFGFTTTLVKDLSEAIAADERTQIDRIISTFFFGLTGVGFILGFLTLGLYFPLDTLFRIPAEHVAIARNTLLILYFLFLLNFVHQVFFHSLFAAKNLYLANALNILAGILSAISSLLFLYMGYSILGIAFAMLIITLGQILATYFVSKRTLGFSLRLSHVNLEILKGMAWPSVHYFIMSIAVMIVFYSDNLVISSFIGVGAVATYSIAYKVIDTSQRIVWKIVDVLIPDIAGMHVRGEFAAMLSLHNRILLYTVLLFVPLGCFLYFWGLDLIGWWVGPENVLQKSVFNVFIAFMLIHSWVHVSAIFVAAIGIHKVPSYMALFEAFVNLLLSMVLARPYGVFGVAIATLAAHVATNAWFVTWWFYRYVSKNTSCSSAQIIQHQNKPE